MKKKLLRAAAGDQLTTLEEAVRGGKRIALCGLREAQAAFIASWLAEETGLRVLFVTANDIRAVHAADDAQQLLLSGTACLPGGELDLTRGASSHESSWQRLETLTRMCAGHVRLLTTSMDALMQRMGSADSFRASILRLAPGDTIRPDSLIRRLVRMGYERADKVEGKGQCALRGSILDVYPPSASQGLRIEFFDDEVDSIRALDCITQRSLDKQKEALLSPASEVLLDPEKAEDAATRMRRSLHRMVKVTDAEPALFADLPPLPEDDEDDEAYFDAQVAPKVKAKTLSASREAEMGHRISSLASDAELVADGLPFRRIRAWLTVLTDETSTLLDWYRPQVVVFSEPDGLRERARERLAGFAEDLKGAMERGEAVREQEKLLMDWDELTAGLTDLPVVATCDLLRGLGGLQPDTVLDLHSKGLPGYGSQVKLLAEDLRTWRQKGMTVALLTGGVSRGRRLLQSLAEQEVQAEFL